MSDLLKKIERDALSLSQQEQAFLADRLLSSLDGDALNDIDVAWIAEAERRYQEYKDGKRKGIPANEVFNEADRILK
jgi:putative addiction module component (TIGR02574 family)